MIRFKPIEIADKKKYLELTQDADTQSCEYCFGNLLAWSGVYPTQIAFEDGCIYLRQFDGSSVLWPLPVAKNNGALKKAMIKAEQMQMQTTGEHAHFVYIDDILRDRINTVFPGCFKFHNYEEFDEYHYTADNFRTYSGKKLHSKKNHFNSFMKTYDGVWKYEELSENNFGECIKFADIWAQSHRSEEGIGTDNEKDVLLRMIQNFRELEFSGGLLRISGEICGFTVAEKCSCAPDTAVIHIEKADDSVRGSYPVLASLFMINNPEFKFVNREEDMGIPGLRRSKISYCPDRIIKKYSCRTEKDLI